MNIVSLNVRRCRNSIKRRRKKPILSNGKVDICFIQETKIQKMGDNLLFRLWGNMDWQWFTVDSISQSSGILTIWRKEVIDSVCSFRGKGFLGLNAR